MKNRNLLALSAMAALATTTRSDLIVPEVLDDAVAAAFAGRQVFEGTNAVVMNNTLDPNKRGGDKVTVPRFGAMSEFEKPAENGVLTPVKLVQSSEEAVVGRYGKAVEMTTWAQWATMYADPYTEAGRQLAIGAQRIIEADLLEKAAAGGIQYAPGTAFSYDALVDALDQFEDEDDRIAFIGLHPTVRTQVRKIKDTQGRPIFEDPRAGNGTSFLLGYPVRVSKRIPKNGAAFRSLIVKEGSLAVWYQERPRTEGDKDILADSKLIATNFYAAVHMYTKAANSTKPGVVVLETT